MGFLIYDPETGTILDSPNLVAVPYVNDLEGLWMSESSEFLQNYAQTRGIPLHQFLINAVKS